MKKILVPTDFSECANRAAAAALKLAETTQSEVHFLHLADIPVDWQVLTDNEKMYPDVNKRVNQYRSLLDELVQDAQRRGITAHKYLVFNRDFQAILEHLDQHKIDFVVMGSRGASGLKEWIVGSNTQKIVRLSPVPVLVIKEDTADFKIDHLVFVSDFNEEVMDQFKFYVEFIQRLKAKMSLVFINTPENFTDTLTIKIKMGNYAMHAPGTIENTYIINHYSFMRGLEAFCQEHKVDVLGMITHGKPSGMHLFNNSLTEKVVNHVQLPVLTMHLDLRSEI
jgi:nucleotide-binding universal stress UspA family protein